MSGAWFFGLSVAINVVSAIVLVWTARNLKRVRDERLRMRRRPDAVTHPTRLGLPLIESQPRVETSARGPVW